MLVGWGKGVRERCMGLGRGEGFGRGGGVEVRARLRLARYDVMWVAVWPEWGLTLGDIPSQHCS